MNEKEKRIKDQRTIEATKKGFMGLGGKFGLILRNYGEPIVGERSLFDQSYLEDPWSLGGDEMDDGFRPGSPEDIQNQMRYFDMPNIEEPVGMGWREERSGNSTPYDTEQIGFFFDGLRRGMHLEIKYMLDSNEISVYHAGYLVYQEIAGDLTAYAPNDDWENMIESLYKGAAKAERQKNKEGKEANLKEAARNKENWLQTVKKRWGL